MSTAIASVSRVVYKAPGPKAHDIQLTCTSVSYIYTCVYVLYYNILYRMMYITFLCVTHLLLPTSRFHSTTGDLTATQCGEK